MKRFILTLLVLAASASVGWATTASRDFVSASSQYLDGTLGTSYTAPLTFACWCNADAGSVAFPLSLFSSADDDTYAISYTESGGKEGYAAYIENGLSDATGFAGTVPNGVWMHLTAGWDGAGNKLVALDGVIEDDVETVTDPTLDDVYVGGLPGATHWDGQIAHCAMWNVFLADKDVEQLATGMLPYHIRPEKLIAYWPLLGVSPEPTKDGIDAASLTVTGSSGVKTGPPVWSK